MTEPGKIDVIKATSSAHEAVEIGHGGFS